LEMEKLSWMIWTEPLGTGHKVITRGEWRINEISSTYFHTLPKAYGNIFVTPFNVSENFSAAWMLDSLLQYSQCSFGIDWNNFICCMMLKTKNALYRVCKIILKVSRGPLAKIISLRGNPLGNRFSVVQCIVP
jgi:hypothetical protein